MTEPAGEHELTERFLALVGHQIRTPITVIGGWLELLVTDQADEEQRELAVAALRRALGRLQALADDLTDVTAVSVGKLELRRELLDLGDLVSGELAAFDDGELHLERQPPTPVVRGDRQRLGRAVRELVAAARRRTLDPLTVRVGVDTTGPWATIDVLGMGPPPEPEALDRLFEPFEDWEGAGEAGLGLYLCRAVAVAHGGDVAADGDHEHTRLRLRLPDRSGVGTAGGASDEAG